MLVPTGEVLALAAHRPGLGANHLHAHRPANDLADFQHRWLERLALFGDKRRIGRHSVQHSQRRRLAYLADISGIKKYFHPTPQSSFFLKKCCHPERGRVPKRCLQLGKPESKDLGFVFPMTRCPDSPISRSLHSFLTSLLSVPMPSIFTATTSLGCIAPTPRGVPVQIRSKGNSVMIREMKRMICATEKM